MVPHQNVISFACFHCLHPQGSSGTFRQGQIPTSIQNTGLPGQNRQTVRYGTDKLPCPNHEMPREQILDSTIQTISSHVSMSKRPKPLQNA
ncbi:predicted protein [Sclerotinia sclerotiorum 1980 UF-70]|uniref:Uncharacterized protein n=1 Tax=Sclerotinia sclerotiorum (strain ATCC 18683 / 1980 / Ss-1) TaxID=665079 RepID=A7F651_SCLS1|nr:predicted protein [Sclerotinia sclerotiorum 1980 UF-70]EDN98222.1 predicted protein [Sclerotinia sclerotiorum 1980 UF-70]